MTTDALLKLASWLSPAYPIGAFAYSQGLEWAIEHGRTKEGALADAPSVEAWVGDTLAHGAGRTEAILLAHAYRSPEDPDIASLAEALAPSAERAEETRALGAAFAETTAAAWGGAIAPAPYPVAVGRAAAAHALPLETTIALYLHAFAGALVSAAVRLVPLGQTDGQRILAALAPLCQSLAKDALTAPIEAIGGCAIAADIASMRHETQRVRLFRS